MEITRLAKQRGIDLRLNLPALEARAASQLMANS
jgi:hypothetical protein